MKFCCFTGQRLITDEEYDIVDAAIAVEVNNAIDHGYQHFLCAFEGEADLVFAQIVADAMQDDSTIHLYAVLPSRAHERALRKNYEARELLELCDDIYVMAEKAYPDMCVDRSRLMAEKSQRVIALYDGHEKGTTASVVRLARELNRDLFVIPYPVSVLYDHVDFHRFIHEPPQQKE